MYLSHAVRTIRDDPMADESVDMVVTLTDDPTAGDGETAFEDEITALGGEVVADLRFSAVHVRLPEPGVAHLCALDGIDRIETAETLRLVRNDATDSATETDGVDTDERERRPDENHEQ